MCLTYPVKITSIKDGLAKIRGKSLEIKTILVPDAEKGDWVLVNANLALKKIEEKEAKIILKLLSIRPSSP